MENFVVSNAPFIRGQNDINKMFIYTAVALMVPTVFGVMFFGIRALFVVLISLASCLVFEILYNLMFGKKFKVADFSCLVTAMILALIMPCNVPYWILILSAFFAVFVVKLAFGGLGRNKFNPAVTARCFAGVVSAGFSGGLYELTVSGENLVSLTAGGTNTIYNLLFGQSVGGIGTTCILVILCCYVFLVYTGIIDFKLPIIAVLAYAITGVLTVGLEDSLMNICSGSFLFLSVFCLTDPNTSPDTLIGKFIYAALFGVLSSLVWNMGVLGENSIFAVMLFVNLLVPFMDKYFVWKPITLGGYRNAYKN